jgi:hypothetical protein
MSQRGLETAALRLVAEVGQRTAAMPSAFALPLRAPAPAPAPRERESADRFPALRLSPIALVSPWFGPAPASAAALAAALQALDGDGCRSQVDAVVWATLSAVIAELPSCGSQLEAAAGYRFDGIACKVSASTRCAGLASRRTRSPVRPAPASVARRASACSGVLAGGVIAPHQTQASGRGDARDCIADGAAASWTRPRTAGRRPEQHSARRRPGVSLGRDCERVATASPVRWSVCAPRLEPHSRPNSMSPPGHRPPKPAADRITSPWARPLPLSSSQGALPEANL